MILNYDQYKQFVKTKKNRNIIENILKIYNSSKFKSVSDYIFKTNYFAFIQDEKKEKIIGIARLLPMKENIKNLLIRNVFIDPAFQGKGYCKVIIDEIVEYFKKRNIQLYLDVDEKNIPAVKCYKRAGFVDFSKVKYEDIEYTRMIYELTQKNNTKKNIKKNLKKIKKTIKNK
jgi:predicted GNAT family N-acyltransferase